MTEDELQQIRTTWEHHAATEWREVYHEMAMRWMVPQLLAEVERLRASEDVVHASSRLMHQIEKTAAADVRIHRFELLLRDVAELDPAEIANYDLVRRARALLAMKE